LSPQLIWGLYASFPICKAFCVDLVDLCPWHNAYCIPFPRIACGVMLEKAGLENLTCFPCFDNVTEVQLKTNGILPFVKHF